MTKVTEPGSSRLNRARSQGKPVLLARHHPIPGGQRLCTHGRTRGTFLRESEPFCNVSHRSRSPGKSRCFPVRIHQLGPSLQRTALSRRSDTHTATSGGENFPPRARPRLNANKTKRNKRRPVKIGRPERRGPSPHLSSSATWSDWFRALTGHEDEVRRLGQARSPSVKVDIDQSNWWRVRPGSQTPASAPHRPHQTRSRPREK